MKRTVVVFGIIVFSVFFLMMCNIGSSIITVTYDGNGNTGGSVPVDSSVYEEGSVVTVLDNTGGLTKTSYSFSGWNTAADGSGTGYTAGETFSMSVNDVTLYATWNTAFTVTYSGNNHTGGSVPTDTTNYEIGVIVNVAAAGTMTRTGYTFTGWNTAPDGSGTTRAAGSTFTMGASNVTLNAWWTNNALEALLYREMVSVPGVTGDIYTQTDTSSNSFIHNISPFSMAKYEVTYELWYTVHNWALSNGYTFANPGREGNDGTVTNPAGEPPTSAKYEPVTTINWRDAMVWCNAYSEMTGYSPVYENGSGQVIKDSSDGNGAECDGAVPVWNNNGYRLPTEGEWQYAASYIDGATWTSYNYGSGGTGAYTGVDATDFPLFDPIAWYGNSITSPNGNTTTTQPVGTKIDNQLALHDMSGNVFEWCWDWNGSYPAGPETDYRGAGSGTGGMLRGGSYQSSAERPQVGNRFGAGRDGEYTFYGIRLLRTP